MRGPRTTASLAFGALFLTLAEFVKPLYVTLPLALLVWLAEAGADCASGAQTMLSD